ncbi:MAG: hypothetical protein JWQ59_1183 [Cryobacterium sp.]|nr:hypothetical protein [Cryobacterium sp.]
MERVVGILHQLVQTHLRFQYAVFALVNIVVGDDRLGRGFEGIGMRAEAVQVAVCPSHRRLHDLVQPIEFDIGRHAYTAPDGRFGPFDLDARRYCWAGDAVTRAVHSARRGCH